MTGCPVTLLSEIVCGLRRDGWELVSLNAAVRRIEQQSTGAPFAVLTFDDGYRDNLTRALPILERLQAPFTIYVPTGAVTREVYAWWLGLRALFSSQDEVTIECMARYFSCGGLASKKAALEYANSWVRRNYRRKSELESTFAKYGISLASLANKYFLNSDELRALARHPLVTIGAHTTSHTALSALAPGQVRTEMADNRTFLERLLDQEIVHLAYPYGSRRACGVREATIAHELGFSSAVTNEASPVFAKHQSRPHRLPRISVRPNETPASLYYRASGLSWAVNACKRMQAMS
jgi:peptidoglycan/xylan/chitin deacetylase (PgdA/CDA1 family)